MQPPILTAIYNTSAQPNTVQDLMKLLIFPDWSSAVVRGLRLLMFKNDPTTGSDKRGPASHRETGRRHTPSSC